MEKKEKLAFTMGLSVGVATVSLIGVLIMGIIFISTNKDKSTDRDKTVRNSLENDKNVNDGLIFVEKLNIPEEKINGVWTRGNKNASVTLLEFSDMQCPYCARHDATLKQIMAAYPDQVKWEYKHFPLDSIHPYARIAAESAECAGDQGAFWSFADMIYANQKSLNNDIFPKIAKRLDLNMDDFSSCVETGKYKEVVSSNLAEGQAKGVRGTPGNFINGVELKGAVPFDQLKAAIDKALSK